jgi:hydrogenase maturation factor HypE
LYANSDTSRPTVNVTMTAEQDIRGTAQLGLSAWTHLAATYDGATLRLYVNGTQVAAKALTGSLAAGTQPLRIGGNGVWGEWFAGQLDEIRVYDRALTAAEVTSDMGRPVVPGTT